MIELTELQLQAVNEQAGKPVELIDPITQQRFVLIRRDLYDNLTEYDAAPWTDEEMAALATEVDFMLDDDMAVEETSP